MILLLFASAASFYFVSLLDRRLIVPSTASFVIDASVVVFVEDVVTGSRDGVAGGSVMADFLGATFLVFVIFAGDGLGSLVGERLVLLLLLLLIPFERLVNDLVEDAATFGLGLRLLVGVSSVVVASFSASDLTALLSFTGELSFGAVPCWGVNGGRLRV